MEENKANEPAPLTTDQVNQVAGGDGDCTTTVQLGGTGGSVTSTYSSLGDAIIGTYDGLGDGTSHIIETVANSMK
jgi:hypothetical protein